MTEPERFLWGFLGSAAVEIVNIVQLYHGKRIVFPERYRRKGFWLTRIILAGLGGALSVAYEIDKAILAMNIGAATPLIIQQLAQGYKEQQVLPQADEEQGKITQQKSR